MTTARERMKQLSGLLGAHSAREHFLAITQGSVPGRTVFASQITVCMSEPSVTVAQKRKVTSIDRREPTKRNSASVSEQEGDLRDRRTASPRRLARNRHALHHAA